MLAYELERKEIDLNFCFSIFLPYTRITAAKRGLNRMNNWFIKKKRIFCLIYYRIAQLKKIFLTSMMWNIILEIFFPIELGL